MFALIKFLNSNTFLVREIFLSKSLLLTVCLATAISVVCNRDANVCFGVETAVRRSSSPRTVCATRSPRPSAPLPVNRSRKTCCVTVLDACAHLVRQYEYVYVYKIYMYI